MTHSETKIWLRSEIDKLIEKGVINNDAHLARELNITHGTLSCMIGLKSNKFPSKNLVEAFRKRYIDPPTYEVSIDELNELKATVKVLFETCVSVFTQSTGRPAALISMELKQAIELNKQDS